MQQPHSLYLLIPEVKELLAAKNYPLLKQVLRECSPMEFSDCWRKFDESERLQIFKLLPGTSALKLFEILEVEDQRNLLGSLSEENLAPILDNLPSPDLAKLFHKLSPRFVKKMTSLMKRQEALAHVDLLMTFPENSAGSLMHPEFVKLLPKYTCRQALSILQAVARPNQKEHLYSLFVTDDSGKVLGALSVHDLIGSAEDEKLSALMTSVEGIKVKADTDQEEVSKLFSKYDLSAVPVVDDEGRLIGILSVKDIIAIIRQEATEDIAKMAGTKATDIRETSASRIFRFRMPWLIVTFFGEIVVSMIIRNFNPILAKVIALASFSPLIAAMGGNVGSQSATVVVRSIALGQVMKHQRIKTIFREMRVGMMLGVVYGLFLGAVSYALYGTQYHIMFSVVVAIAMCTSMTVASTMGAIEPIFFHKIGVDPATATGPLITTITDIISNFVYLGLATLLLTQL